LLLLRIKGASVIEREREKRRVGEAGEILLFLVFAGSLLCLADVENCLSG
jgi:hypothetical protein